MQDGVLDDKLELFRHPRSQLHTLSNTGQCHMHSHNYNHDYGYHQHFRRAQKFQGKSDMDILEWTRFRILYVLTFYDLTGLLVRSRALLSYYYLRSGAIEGLWEHRL